MTTSSDIAEQTKQRLMAEMQRRAGVTAKPAEPEAPPQAVLKAGTINVLNAKQKMFSDVFGYVSSLGDFPVTLYDATDFDSSVHAFIPKVDPTYNPQKEEVAMLAMAFENDDKSLITGPTGSGKSSMVKYVCAKLGRPLIRLNMKEDIESSSVFGTVGAKDGSTVWTDGPATEAVRNGAVLMVDEWDVTPPGIMFGFQFLLERGGSLYVAEMPGTSDDRMIKPDPKFRIVCCGNTVGQGDDTGHFAGTTPQNTATLDRFDTSIKLDYLGVDHEMEILKNNAPAIEEKYLKQMIQLAGLIRAGYKESRIGLTLSPRSLIGWALKTVQLKGDIKRAFTISYANKLRESDFKVVNELYTKVFGK